MSTDPSTGLVSGWEVRHSRTRNLPYYFHPATSNSSWEPPAGTDSDLLKQYMATNYSQKNTAVPNTAPGAGNGSGQKIRVSHLLIKHRDSRRPSSWKDSNIERTKEEARAILEGHQAKIKAGETTIGDLAVSESDCSSARKRGDLGFFGKGEMQAEFEQASFALENGQVSDIVETASGLHLIERTG
ncbi:Peptidyl-prolyl cis-trans isomerase ssp-1 [Yarrowia sp. C11]|nr:Peptidyl-prolyl cis-trans isomerase ssp-1 [Yarrowia sp. E02]KAG5372735.1 Peptidyl-prolyl cis-trans isomerase ssp-1 [Yarrowia sp. C11]